MNTLPRLLSSIVVCLSLLLAGCDQIGSRLGLEDPARKAARLEAEGKAVGGACRQSGRAIEDCYAIYTWVPKESVFEGWREMDEYMRENNLETIAPILPPPPPPSDASAKKKKKAAPVETPEADDADRAENESGKGVAPTASPFSAPVPVQQPAARAKATAPAASAVAPLEPAAASAAPATPAAPNAAVPAQP